MNPAITATERSLEPPVELPRRISVLVPVCEHPHALDALYDEFAPPLRAAGLEYEFLFLVEPSFRTYIPSAERLVARGEPVRIIEVAHMASEATLLRVGVERAHFEILVTLPAYPRIEAAELVKVIQPVLDGAAMAVARRWPRRDSWLNQLQNRVFHSMVGSAGGDHFHDMACGVRSARRSLFSLLPLYGTFHRFLPLLARRAGHHVVEVEATQHPGDRQARVYSPRTYVRRLIDVFGLYFLVRFTEKPLRFFGQVGVLACFLGGAILAVLVIQRIAGEPMADRPMLLFGALLLVLGVQAIALGLVGEMIVYLHAPRRRSYRLASEDEEQKQ